MFSIFETGMRCIQEFALVIATIPLTMTYASSTMQMEETHSNIRLYQR